MLNNKQLFLVLMATLWSALPLFSQYNGASTGIPSGNYWHGKERQLRYQPDGEDFVIVNGTNRFNRALYGTNTGFRVEAGDRPEFALYMPNMGGNLQLGVIRNGESRWLSDMQYVEFRYRPGSALYTIQDPFLGKGVIQLSLIPLADSEGLVLKVETQLVAEDMDLFICFGGANNKRFSREGDLGVDPVDCFELKPDYCLNNLYEIRPHGFDLYYGGTPDVLQKLKQGNYPVNPSDKKRPRKLSALLPGNAQMKLASAYAVTTPLDLWNSTVQSQRPVLVSRIPLTGSVRYLSLFEGLNPQPSAQRYDELDVCFQKAEAKRSSFASSIRIVTPDPYLNPVGGALAIAADGIWESPAWLHGAIGWRMPLSGWRAAYTGDVLGQHDRARIHFDAYAASQVTDVEPVYPHPTQDPEKNMARAEKKWGTQMYSNGYICRNPNNNKMMHHYDMNLCYIDELLWHFDWTGDWQYVRQMWPVLERHLAWEKRNFDPDNDGLYDAYCCIWASDALQYNSGAVTHSSAYNYRANKKAAQIARKIGMNAAPYEAEAKKILKAINQHLWLPRLGHWAEYKDFMGLKKVHQSAAIWTIYHAIDSDVHTPFQAYEATYYVDHEIPHIPVRARGLKDEGYATLSTTNWFPYSWSINNVAFAEVAHMALAYWQSGRNEEAFKLLKSSFLDGMYLGTSPGNFGQISFYDAVRGECYRDFGDPIGITSRALIQGLFGIIPDRLNQQITLRPGFPQAWPYASIQTPDLKFSFKRNNQIEHYQIELESSMKSAVSLELKASYEKIEKVLVNGKPAKWSLLENAIEQPMIRIQIPSCTKADVQIVWGGALIQPSTIAVTGKVEDAINISCAYKMLQIKDNQQVLKSTRIKQNQLSGIVIGEPGSRLLFVQLQQGMMKWWQPIQVQVAAEDLTPASQYVLADLAENDNLADRKLETINLDAYFNSSVNDIFQNRYESPRSPYTTLQVPLQGIGEWCHPDMTAEIDDSGIRQASKNGVFTTPFGLPFRLDGQKRENIVYTSLWDNYPNQVQIPLTGKAKRAYLLMAGSTNHMQVHFVNAVVRVQYTDGTESLLELINPTTWAPIEQDFYFDEQAFRCPGEKPYRVALKSGRVSRNLGQQLNLHRPDNRRIPGGAAIILDLPLQTNKQLKSLTLICQANEVVIGLMGVTLER